MKVEESLNMTFNESPPLTKLSPLVDDDVGEEEAIKKNTRVVNNNNKDDESIEVDEVVNIKESKNHPLDQDLVPLPMSQSVIGTQWVFRNKSDENGIVSRNKARLEDSKPTKTSMSTEIKLTKDDEADSRIALKNPKTTHLEAVKRIFRNEWPLQSPRPQPNMSPP
ncbi:hypothetical protein Tco_1262238 [Tanacetum coccineum]